MLSVPSILNGRYRVSPGKKTRVVAALGGGGEGEMAKANASKMFPFCANSLWLYTISKHGLSIDSYC